MNFINNEIKEIYKNGLDHNLYIPYLTPLDGNCLYHSLLHLNVISDVDKFKQILSYYLLLFKNYKKFFKNQPNTSLQDLFNSINEIEYVYRNHKLYKYTYSTMCHDLLTANGWARIPTELVLMFISKLFDMEFHIINHTSYVHIIDTCENMDKKRTIYLGLINECHYIPMCKNDTPDVVPCPEY